MALTELLWNALRGGISPQNIASAYWRGEAAPQPCPELQADDAIVTGG